MRPLPETVEAIRELTRGGDTEVAESLARMSAGVTDVVPDLVGMSLSLIDEGLTFTLTSTGEVASRLDGVQFADSGPCESAVATGETTTFSDDSPLDEERWRLFAQAAASADVASTLSLPIVRDGDVVGVVNLYASAGEAFAGHHQELADVCGAWAPGAVSNADLGFATSTAATEAPAKLRARSEVDLAVGVLAVSTHVDTATAEQRLHLAAQRAGISVQLLARTVLELSDLADPGSA